MYLIISFIFVFVINFSEEKIIENHHLKEFNVKQLLSLYGYPMETHHVVTEDGYILEFHRIPHGLYDVQSDYRPPVLIVSGFLCSSADWINLGFNRSLGLILADNGYDVWLCNNRGTTWSKKHIKFDPTRDSNKFWDFSFQDIASYDLPAGIDYILSKTNHKKLYYIGHSQGTISYFALLSEKPHYNNKIRLMFAVGPADTIKYAQLPFEIIYSFLEGYQKSKGDNNEHYEIFEHSGFLASALQLLCSDELPLNALCAAAHLNLEGYAPSQLNKTILSLIYTNFPAGGSIKQLRHFIQSRTGGFRKYNYGKLKNRKLYGQDIPPSYNLSKATTPVALYYGEKDAVLSYKRGKYLAENLPNVVADKFIKNFAHLDFLWGIDAVTIVYNDILARMKIY